MLVSSFPWLKCFGTCRNRLCRGVKHALESSGIRPGRLGRRCPFSPDRDRSRTSKRSRQSRPIPCDGKLGEAGRAPPRTSLAPPPLAPPALSPPAHPQPLRARSPRLRPSLRLEHSEPFPLCRTQRLLMAECGARGAFHDVIARIGNEPLHQSTHAPSPYRITRSDKACARQGRTNASSPITAFQPSALEVRLRSRRPLSPRSG